MHSGLATSQEGVRSPVKLKHALAIAGVVVTAGVAIEKYYEHPTLGNGLQAFLAAISLGRLF
jgi:hypothetical protein